MNTSILKKRLLALSLAVFLFTVLSSFSTVNNTVITENNKDLEIKITIDKNTKDSDFKNIIATLKKHHIEAEFTKIKRNKNNEIVAIKINLKDDKGNESSTSLSSKEPIATITLGADKDSLYVTSSNSKNFSFNGTHSLSKHFDFSFDDDEHVMIINGKKIDFDDIKNTIKDAFVFEDDEDGKRMIIKLQNFDFDFDDDDSHEDDKVWVEKEAKQTFHFVDDPEIEKLIMIDGKKVSFEKLDELAKSNKLKSVDFLKPDTAQSIYGKSAKDGAIIATTKK